MEFDRERRKVLIASGSDKGIEYLTGQLSGGRYDTSYPVASAAEARRRLDSVAYDILIVNTPLKDEFGADFASGEAENSNIGVVLIVKNEIYDQIADKTEDSGVIVLSKPLSSSALTQAVRVAAALRARLVKEEKKTETMQKRMDEIRLVNHAKWVLISKLGMDEENAHRFIEKQAMDLRQTRSEVSQFIIRTYENQ